jgi:uncharacterized membrane protein
VRAGLAVLLGLLAGVALGLLIPRFTTDATVAGAKVSSMLTSASAALLGLVSVIYSLLFVVVQFVFTSLSPRLTAFRDARIVWRTFGFVVGLFAFSATAALLSAGRAKVTVVLPVTEAVGLLTAIFLIFVIQVRAFASIQLGPVLAAITRRGLDLIRDFYPDHGPERGVRGAALRAPPGRLRPLPPLRRTVRWRGQPATVQQFDLSHLLRIPAGCVVAFRVGPGESVIDDQPVADVHGADVHGADVHGADVHGADVPDEAVLAALSTGTDRRFNQDPLLAFRLLADIGLRALSPAVNDPATTVQVLDSLDGLLNSLAGRELDLGDLTDDRGDAVVRLHAPDWDAFLRVGLDDLVEAAARSPMVLQRARALLAGLRQAVPAGRIPAVDWRLARAEELLAGGFPAIWAHGPR